MFKSFINANVTLEKQNGEYYEDIEACVQTKQIFIDDATIPIEEGDIIIRKLDNGLVERYIVLDRGFFEAQGGFPAHYQVDVKKESRIKVENENRPMESVVYNLNGANTRVNINSTDNSHNVVNMDSSRLFEELRAALNEIENNEEKRELRMMVNEMELNQGSPEFNSSYTKFITNAASHMTLISPFIPALSQMIAG